jgi:3'(2'), 5'-bisphosphate nucleotidase
MKKTVEDILNIVSDAGKAILDIYGREYNVSKKIDDSPVTEADLVSNKIIVKGLEKYGWPIISEEINNKINIKINKFWILDPLDGTADFIQKTGEFSIMLGLVENNKPVLGVVYQPCKDKMYYAELNNGAYLKEKGEINKLQASKKEDLSECRIVFSRNHLGPRDIELAKLMGIKKIIKSGSNGIKIGLIAENKADIFFNLTDKMGKWDSCAPEIILTEAGGMLSDTLGNEIKYNEYNAKNKQGILASNNIVHNKIIKYLKND